MPHLLLDLAPPGLTATLPPAIQQSLGIISAITLLAGLLAWAAGVKIARLVVALVLALTGAAVATSYLPPLLTITPLTAGILGLVAGTLLGLFTFRLLQGLTLALCLSLAVAGLYYQWHIPHQHAGPLTTQAADLLARTDLLPPEPATSHPAFSLTATLKSLGDQLNALPPQHYKRLLIASLATALLALLLAFEFPRFTTWIITATLGSLLILISSHALATLYFPTCESYFPTHPIPRYLLLAALTLVGLLIQYRFFPPPTDTTPKQATPPQPKTA